LMDVPRQLLHMFEWSVGKDPVSQIEDVACSATRAPKDVVRGAEEAVAGTEEQRGIEVPLNGARVPDDRPGFVERLPPVDADDVAAGVREIRENRGRAD